MDFLSEDQQIIGELSDIHEKYSELKKKSILLAERIKNDAISKYLSGRYACNYCGNSDRYDTPELINHDKNCIYIIAKDILREIG